MNTTQALPPAQAMRGRLVGVGPFRVAHYDGQADARHVCEHLGESLPANFDLWRHVAARCLDKQPDDVTAGERAQHKHFLSHEAGRWADALARELIDDAIARGDAQVCVDKVYDTDDERFDYETAKLDARRVFAKLVHSVTSGESSRSTWERIGVEARGELASCNGRTVFVATPMPGGWPFGDPR